MKEETIFINGNNKDYWNKNHIFIEKGGILHVQIF